MSLEWLRGLGRREMDSRGSLSDLLRDIGAGARSSAAAVDECLAEIRQRNPQLNAFLLVMEREARTAARESDLRRAAGEAPRALEGVPIALKDLFLTRGVRTTAGSKILADWVPEEDATVVRRLREAGAVNLGKLQMHEFAYGPTSENCHHGPARNPHDPTRITGGSSGGSAAAVAAGLCYGALGTDTGGSIRLPAALCGIVGLKPTYGRISRSGVIPLSWTLDHVGPMTRTVEDAGLLLDVLSGPDPRDPTAAHLPPADWRPDLEQGVAGLRLGILGGWFREYCDPAVAGEVENACRGLEREGARLVDVDFPWMEEARAAHHLIIRAEASTYHRLYLQTRAEDYDPRVRVRLVEGLAITATDYIDALRARSHLQGATADAMAGVDALLSPACPITAPAIGAATVRAGESELPPTAVLVRNTFLFNLVGLPALSVPCGNVDGLPVGLQIAGRPWSEALLLRIGRALERPAC